MGKEEVEPYVLGPDGPLYLKDLPEPGFKGHWNAERKWEVIAAVDGGLLTLEEACKRYNLLVEEFLSWREGKNRLGKEGLRATRKPGKSKKGR